MTKKRTTAAQRATATSSTAPRVAAGHRPAAARSEIDRLAEISAWLRKEREFSFYGDIDFIPTEQYTEADAKRAIADAEHVVRIAALVIPAPKS